MIDYNKTFAELDQFLSGYFHQDWKDDYDWENQESLFESVVRHYKTEDTAEGIDRTTVELKAFLDLPISNEQLHKIVEEDFSSWYTPHSRGMNKRRFLEKILETLEQNDNEKPLKRIV